MAKVTNTAVLLVAMVVLATTTTIYAAGDRYHYMRCMSETRGRRFESCQRYMKERSAGNPYKGSTPLTECCQQLGSISSDCRCDVIQYALSQSGSYQGQQNTQVRDRARNLPIRCNFRQAQRCQI